MFPLKLIAGYFATLIVTVIYTNTSKAEIFESSRIVDRAGRCVKLDYEWRGTFTYRNYNGWICTPSAQSRLDSVIKNEVEAIKRHMQDPGNRPFYIKEKRDQIAKYKSKTTNTYSKACADEYGLLYLANLISPTGFFRDSYCSSIDNEYSLRCLIKVAQYKNSAVFDNYIHNKLSLLSSCSWIDNQKRLSYLNKIIAAHASVIDAKPEERSFLSLLNDRDIKEVAYIYDNGKSCVLNLIKHYDYFHLPSYKEVCNTLDHPEERKCLSRTLNSVKGNDYISTDNLLARCVNTQFK